MTGLISSRSSVVHKPFSLFCHVLVTRLPGALERFEVVTHRGRVRFMVQPQRPAESPALGGLIMCFDGRCEPRSPTRHDCLRVRHDAAVAQGDDTEKRGPGSTTATADACSDGNHLTPPLRRPRSGTPGPDMPRAKPAAPTRSASRCPQSSPSRIESGWMSIRAPVSFAARRAFCPSLPIARDSW